MFLFAPALERKWLAPDLIAEGAGLHVREALRWAFTFRWRRRGRADARAGAPNLAPWADPPHKIRLPTIHTSAIIPVRPLRGPPPGGARLWATVATCRPNADPTRPCSSTAWNS